MRYSAVIALSLGLTLLTAIAQAENRQFGVHFNNGDVELAGTVLMPEDGGPFPGLVLVHGSGPGERSGMLEIATRLAAGGMAVLIYDKRGSGQSGGNWITSSLVDLATDAAAAFRFLADQPDVDPERSGYWGISQGGWVVPLAANQSRPAFTIVVTGGGATPKEVEINRYNAIVSHVDDSKEIAAAATELFSTYFDYLAGATSYEALMEVVAVSETEDWFSATEIERVIPGPSNRENWEWVATFDPRESIRELTVPALVLLGAKDPLSPTTATAQAWRESLPASVEHNQVIVFPDAGHGMRTGEHGGDFVADFFATQFNWLRTIGVLQDMPQR